MKNSIKKLSVFVFLFSLGLGLNAQEVNSDSTKSDNNIKISFGNTKVIIIRGEDSADTIKVEKKKSQRYNHFAGIDMGINGFVSPSNSIDLQKDAEFLDVDYGTKSLEIAINIWEKYMPITKEKFGLMTGLGIKYNGYSLKNDVLVVNQSDSTFGVEDPTKNLSKNKFKTTSLQVPFMLETNLGKDAEHSFHLAVGAMVNWRIGSKTKQKYKQDGERFKKKDKNDFNINPFQFAAVARLGYGDFTLYASYSLTPLFEKDKGPEVYPFTVGLSLVSF
ncbi:MAG: PorT family protein [Flavobacteriales bacterium]|nr:PorT family protein [Flavobacteriales bacterium]